MVIRMSKKLLVGTVATTAVAISGLLYQNKKMHKVREEKKDEIKTIDATKLSADELYTATYCYNHYEKKFKDALTVSSVEAALNKMNEIAEKTMNPSVENMVSLKLLKDNIDDSKRMMDKIDMELDMARNTILILNALAK